MVLRRDLLTIHLDPGGGKAPGFEKQLLVVTSRWRVSEGDASVIVPRLASKVRTRTWGTVALELVVGRWSLVLTRDFP